MTKKELYDALQYVNHSRQKRAEMSNLVNADPALIRPLIAIAFTIDDPISMRACWVMEFAAKENLAYIFPHLNVFTHKIASVRFDSSVRPMAKICEYLITSYFSKSPNAAQTVLTEIHLEHISTACFDWLIGDHKVAAQAYAMTCLLLLGRKFGWIHPELKMVLERNYAFGSAAYKARARMTLARLK